ncbi:MAG: hypothetical protein IAG10_14940 [Planctomycetaceae bacterium]|nr:hypothetical protein [Planctomycetaceae bacterium]
MKSKYGEDDLESSTQLLMSNLATSMTDVVKQAIKDVLNEFDFEKLLTIAAGKTVRDVKGGYFSKEEDPTGQFVYRLVDGEGRRHKSLGYYDECAKDATTAAIHSPNAVVSEPDVSERDASDIAKDMLSPLPDRIEALNEWIFLDNDSAAAFVLDELKNGEANDEWLTALVFAAEDVKLPLAEQQDQAARLLRDVALNLRNRAEARFERVVWSAIRRFGSLVPVENADQLLNFLDRKGAVDTRLVALQSVVHIFELEPLADPATVQRLADRVFELAIKLLDRDLLFPGEIAAIVEQAIQALACMGDPRLRDCFDRLPSVEAPWFAELVNRNLRGLLDEWSEHVGEPAYQQIVDVLRGGV